MTIEEFLTQIWITFVGMLPRVAGAMITLIIGWIAVRALCKAGFGFKPL